MTDFAKQDPRFRFDILATGLLRRALELKAPSLLPVHDQLTPHIEQLASDLLGPKAIEKRFGLKVNKVTARVKRASGKKKAAKVKVVDAEVVA